MKFSDFVAADAIRSTVVANTKEGVIREMAQSLVDAGKIAAGELESIVKAIMKREDLGSTGIGRGVAVVGRAFGMRVIHHRRQCGGDPACVDLDTLFRESDVVSLHCPLTAENRGMVDTRRLELMKPSGFLINTARGPLVNEADLAAALNAGRIAGAAVDVLSVEPPPASNPLLTARNCILTPHIAWATRHARRRLIDVTAANLAAFIAGRPQNVV